MTSTGRPEHEAARIAAIDLDDEARHAVDEHVAPERAARERPAHAFRAEQQSEDQQLGARFVELGRVQMRCGAACRRWRPRTDR